MQDTRTHIENNRTRVATRVVFLYAWVLCASMISGGLYFIDLVPDVHVEAREQETNENIIMDDESAAEVWEVTPSETEPVFEDAEAVAIEIGAIGLTSSISHPESTSIEALDEALLQGAVQYPGTAQAGEVGTMLLFGHSSYLPLVHNKAYQAFNNIQKLETGDMIDIYSRTHRYMYEVVTVERVRAADAVISFRATESILSLATCNSFGSKDDRFVVTARLVGKELLPDTSPSFGEM